MKECGRVSRERKSKAGSLDMLYSTITALHSVVQAPHLFIQEKVYPKALIDDLLRWGKAVGQTNDDQPDFFVDFNGLPDDDARTEGRTGQQWKCWR